MSVEEIKRGLAILTKAQQAEVSAFLFSLRHAHDPAYQEAVDARLKDREAAHWATPEEFERRLGEEHG